MKKLGFFKNKPIVVTAIAVLLLVVLALFTSGEKTVSWLENAFNTVATPVQSFAQSSSTAVVNFFKGLFNTTDADKENSQLKSKIAQLEVAVDNLEELRKENERLKELLNYSEMPEDTQYVSATVIANSGDIWYDTFTLNAGRTHGVSAGDPVVNEDGLVGIVSDVGANWCKVRSIIDPQSRISVFVSRTRDSAFIRGVLSTGSDGNMTELYFLPAGSELIPGDTVITTGFGSTRIPKGLTVGTVTEVVKNSGTDSDETDAIVTPAVDFLHVEDVMIIINYGGNNDAT